MFLLKKIILFCWVLFAASALKAQDSCGLRITLLTCAPGTELYSTFGHTAIRVQDPLSGSDEVYNYGTFEFSPEFYSQFIRGKLRYYLSVQDFTSFMSEYQQESRSVQEQELLTSCTEKQKLLAALNTNALEQNRYYRYDFLFDNCTTRAKEMIDSNAASTVVFQNILPPVIPTFRDLIHQYLNAGHQHWSKLGIDLLLGARLDRKATNEEAMFLPENLLHGMDKATTGQHPVMSPPRTILAMPSPLENQGLATPGVVFTLLFLLAGGLSFVRSPRVQKGLMIFDFLFFFILGLAGILMVFMWTGTDHQMCRNNYNLLWALPTHAIFAFGVQGTRPVFRNYFKAVALLSLALLITWFFLPQQLNPALIPIVLLILIRSWFISKRKQDDRT
jgi:hypothetical protein